MSARYLGVVATHPESPVVNSQPAGIGRLEVFGDRLAVNNLGRNLEFCRLSEGGLLAARRFAATAYPGKDDASQFDLDFHAVSMLGEANLVLALNHLGSMRVFDALEAWLGSGPIDPIRTLTWHGDVVRAVTVHGCLVSTGSAGYAVEEPARPGLLVSAPIDPLDDGERPAARCVLEERGTASALAVGGAPPILVAGFGDCVLAVKVRRARSGEVRVGPVLWERSVAFSPTWLAVGPGATVWAAGPDSTAASADDWESLQGGGAERIDGSSGKLLDRMRFPVRLAWGNGGVPLCVGRGGRQLFGMDEQGSLCGWEIPLGGGGWRMALDGEQEQPRGIAHMARVGRDLLCGFNRDGYRLHRYRLEG